MSGRPVNEDRKLAIFMGEKTYIGAEHDKCGTTERYVSGGGCVYCARIVATEQRDARKYLKSQAASINQGPPESLDDAEAVVPDMVSQDEFDRSIDELM